MKKPMPILILDNTSDFGGAITSLNYLLRALAKDKFRPILVTGQPREFLAQQFDCIWYHFVPKLSWVDNLVYCRIAALRLFRIRLFQKMLNLSRFLYWVIFVTIPEACWYVRLGVRHQVTLVHLNNILGSQLAGIIAAKLLRVPCVAHLRDFEEIHPITRFYARMIDHHVAISGAVRDNLRQLGVPDSKITVVHDAIDLADFQLVVEDARLARQFQLAPGIPTFGIFGRVVEWKGIREFILAVRQVVNDIPEARAFVVGGPAVGGEVFFRSMRQFALDLGLEENLIFTGYRTDVPALMGLMDVIVHASTRPEPFGMVIIEGMAMKKPVVATRGGGPLDIVVDGETGYLVEMGNAKALGNSISTLLRQRDLRETMGLAGFARVAEYFTSQLYASQMADIYHNVRMTA